MRNTFAVSLLAAAVLYHPAPTAAAPAVGGLDSQVVRYAQTLFIGPPTRFMTAEAKQIEPIRKKAIAYFESRSPEALRRELNPYLETLRPGTFAFSAVAYALAYYTAPSRGPDYPRYAWEEYVEWATTPYGFPQPEKSPLPNLMERPMDEGQTVNRALVRLFRKHPRPWVLFRFFELQLSDGGTGPYLEATLMLLNENPTLVMDHAGNNKRALDTIVRAITYREFGGAPREKAVSVVRQVAQGRDASAARAAREVLESVEGSGQPPE